MTEVVAPLISKYVNHTITLNYVNPNSTKNKVGGLISLTEEEKSLLSFVFEIAENIHNNENDIETIFQYKNSKCLYQYSKEKERYYIYVIRYADKEKYEYHIVKNNLEAFTKNDGNILHAFFKKHFYFNNDIKEYVKRDGKE
jgi:hypothetical protein